ncbi:hypothetical protein HRW18_32100 [Streptomyces lunaelactis]|uniref:hypothetical protein n=1 Tax=Streptomyces lunaelactis TaxID=1535768 RepID=UPI0015854FC1|nr:hypothetical protein [Streptomyces lunaelactis]NUK12535.1 hypothetical protein [Streptomyces lunaelactis]NUK61938.1 hypothetical protein [Streptomyces lunaelactis]NUL14638.1 hypothetical protein [Streptomyces lunaelactis]NUL27437.1 hypothetical protein [Streptomyces lunaelactis]
MKIRHVRAIAVFGIAIVALTGARGSHGGSCGGGSSSSSHGSGDNNTTTSGGSTGSVTGGSSANKAERDVRIDECGLDATGKNLTAKITVTNSDSLAYKYDVSLQFKGDLGDTNVSVATAKVDALQVAAGASATDSASTAYTGSGDGSEYKKCEVVSATRTVS